MSENEINTKPCVSTHKVALNSGLPTDETPEDRRNRHLMDFYESDNFHEDEQAELELRKMASERSANVPKRMLTRAAKKKKMEKPSRFGKIANYRKLSKQIVEENEAKPAQTGAVSDMTIACGEPKHSAMHFCAVCGLEGPYTCTACGTRFCGIPCYKTHCVSASRCLIYT